MQLKRSNLRFYFHTYTHTPIQMNYILLVIMENALSNETKWCSEEIITELR